jgi:PAS domain S-box-containing protein
LLVIDLRRMRLAVDNDEFEHRIIAGAPDGVLYADHGGIIRFWNAGCQRIFGFTAQEAIGQSLDIIIPDNLRARHWQGYAGTMRSGQTCYGAGDLLAVPALCRDSRRISVEFSIIPFRDSTGAMAGIAAITRCDQALRGDEGLTASTQGFGGTEDRLSGVAALMQLEKQ